MITRVVSSMMPHYWILVGDATPPPLIRSFATNQRREVPTWEPQARQRWLTWYLDFTISHDSINEDRSAFAALDEEYKNIVAALQWTLAQDHSSSRDQRYAAVLIAGLEKALAQ